MKKVKIYESHYRKNPETGRVIIDIALEDYHEFLPFYIIKNIDIFLQSNIILLIMFRYYKTNLSYKGEYHYEYICLCWEFLSS